LKIDEVGTEAAAVTVVVIGITSGSWNNPDNPFYMRIDRPFIFVIKDNHANSLLFIGKIINPSGK
jgi:serine protease inhibitor